MSFTESLKSELTKTIQDNEALVGMIRRLQKPESARQGKLNSGPHDDTRGKQEQSCRTQQDSKPVSRSAQAELKALNEMSQQLHLKNAKISALQLSEERCNMVMKHYWNAEMSSLSGRVI